MTEQICLEELVSGMVGTELDQVGLDAIEGVASEQDPNCLILECPQEGCDRETAVILRGDELSLLQDVVNGMCARRKQSQAA